MNNIFLKVNKDLFKLGLNPTEILILAQVIEFNTNTGNCFITDKQLAEQFGVSESTISREIKKIETLGYIKRETKNVKGGKERIIKVNLNKIEEKLTSVNLSVDGEEKQDLQQSNCLLTTGKLPIDKEQNDLIKDNIKDNLKDNSMGELKTPSRGFNSPVKKPEEEKPVEKKQQDYLKISKRELDAMGARYELVVGNLGYIVDTGVKIEVI